VQERYGKDKVDDLSSVRKPRQEDPYSDRRSAKVQFELLKSVRFTFSLHLLVIYTSALPYVIIYTLISGLEISFLIWEREHGRFRGSSGSTEGARGEHIERTFVKPLHFVYNDIRRYVAG